MNKVFEDFYVLITEAMNDSLSKNITKIEVFQVVDSMDAGKTPGHDEIPMEFSNAHGQLWVTTFIG